MVVGFYLSESLSAIGCIKALTMAINSTPYYHNLIHHSDRGIQYCSNAYIKILKKANIKISMTQSGDPRENAIAERVNGILKTEFLEDSYANIDIALFSIEQGIKTYNMKRPHSSIDMLTPSSAHISSGGVLKQRWKSYYKKVKRKEVSMM
jgi:transposase InsO family protein